MSGIDRRSLLWIGAALALLLALGAAWVLAQPRAGRADTGSTARDRTAVLLISGLPLSAPPDPSAPLTGFADGPLLAAMRAATDLREVESLPPPASLDTAVWWIAHPRALPPAALAAIDGHVRAGGRALIFADGLYTGEMPYPIGDARNPPVTSLLTPLLDHWGVTLDSPAALAVRDEKRRIRGQEVVVRSPGTLRAPRCRVFGDGVMADCDIGRGFARIVADADFLTKGDSDSEATAAWVIEQVRELQALQSERTEN